MDLTCGARGTVLDVCQGGGRKSAFSLLFPPFSPGVKRGRKKTGLFVKPQSQTLKARGMFKFWKTLWISLVIMYLVTRRGYELCRHWAEETQKSGSDPFVGLSGTAEEKQSPLTTRETSDRTIRGGRGGGEGSGNRHPRS